MQAPPLGAQMPQLGLQQNWPAAQVFEPQVGPGGGAGTQAQTAGSPLKTSPFTHNLLLGGQTQSPPQSAPPCLGSQESLGSS